MINEIIKTNPEILISLINKISLADDNLEVISENDELYDTTLDLVTKKVTIMNSILISEELTTDLVGFVNLIENRINLGKLRGGFPILTQIGAVYFKK